MRIVFAETLARNVRFYEEIIYNVNTDTLIISSRFAGDHGIKLPIIRID